MAMISEEHDPSCSADLSAAVALFRSLGDVTRLVIVHELARGERRIVDLTRAVGLAQSTVSAHVACLRDCGLVEGRPQGRQMLYRLTRPELGAVLAAAERLLAATGNAVALCPVYGDPGKQVTGG
jgi:DNA-binding transcriptional ArsR family regulator